MTNLSTTIDANNNDYNFVIKNSITTKPNSLEGGVKLTEKEPQRKVLIVYNKFNIDSTMAAVLMQIVGFDKAWDMQFLNRSRSDTHIEIPKKFDEYYFMGVEPDNHDINDLFNDNDSAKFNTFSYSEPPSSKQSSLITNLIDKGMFITNYVNEGDMLVEDKHTISSMVATKYMQDDSFAFVGHDVKMYRTYIGAILKYIEFMPMSEAETVFLHSNMNVVRGALTGEFTNSPMVFQAGESIERKREYTAYVSENRDLIKANWRKCYYNGANGASFQTPTISVTEKDSLHVMSMINCAYPDVTSYEDKRDCRVYRILSTNAAPWYIKRFEPMDMWKEGSLVYLTVELNQKHVS